MAVCRAVLSAAALALDKVRLVPILVVVSAWVAVEVLASIKQCMAACLRSRQQLDWAPGKQTVIKCDEEKLYSMLSFVIDALVFRDAAHNPYWAYALSLIPWKITVFKCRCW